MRILFGLVFTLFTLSVLGCNNQKISQQKLEKIRKGVVVYPSDLTSVGISKWLNMAHDAGINLIGIHSDTRLETLPKLKAFLKSDQGKLFYSECEKYNIEVEYEQHILMEFLPRDLFEDHPEYFRVDKEGKRNGDYNMCFTSKPAMEIIQQNAIEMAKWLKPTSHRYFFWTDDVQLYCHCDECNKYTPSEQVLLYENALLEALKKYDTEATVAHLAYGETIVPPVKVKPLPGVFLEFAPIKRDYKKAMPQQQINNLKGNLEVFPTETAHMLEYWLDVSLFSGWKRENLTQPPWNQELFSEDVRIYSDADVKSITTFAAWINGAYIEKFGEKHTVELMNNYGKILDENMK